MAGQHTAVARKSAFSPSTKLGRAGLGAFALGMVGGAVVPNAIAAEADTPVPAERVALAAKPAASTGTGEVKSVATGAWAFSDVTVTATKNEDPAPQRAATVRDAHDEARGVEAAPSSSTSRASGAQDLAQTDEAPAPASASATGAAIAAYASQFVGAPYLWAGTSPSGWDCVGFTQYVYAHFGISAPRSHALSAYSGFQRVSASEAQPGDIMVWAGRHTAVYLGGGKNVSALNPQSGTGILPNTILGGDAVFFRLAN